MFHQFLDAAVSHGELRIASVETVYWGIEAGFQGVMSRIAAGGFGPRSHTTTLPTYFDNVADFMIAGLVGAPVVSSTPHTHGEK